MANNTIINVPAPKYGIREIVYVRESALLGYLEPLKVEGVQFSPDIGKNFYYFYFRKSQPSVQIAGDAIDLKNGKGIQIIEDDLLTYGEALSVKKNALLKELSLTNSQIESNTGFPTIDVTDSSTTSPLDFGNVTVNSAELRTYTISNNSSAVLRLSAVLAYGDPDFTIDSQPEFSIPANSTSEFIVRFSPTVTGRRVGVIQIPNNDPTSLVMSFTIEGIGT